MKRKVWDLSKEIQFLVTKSGENQTQYHFEKISRLLTYGISALLYQVDWIVGFALTKVFVCSVLCGKERKQKKIPFSVTKSVQNLKSISLLKALDVNYMEFLLLFFTPTLFESQKHDFL